MTMLFESVDIGGARLVNRIMHSATHESAADASGFITEAIMERYRVLADTGIGLIVPGAMNVNPTGRFGRFSNSICDDACIPGLNKLVDIIHSGGCKVAFQLNHAGRQTYRSVIGRRPVAPSRGRIDPMFLAWPKVMSHGEIESTIDDFVTAARRAFSAGADGVQFHAGHGWLINQFISPFFNRRHDSWGGSDGNRFRFLAEIVIRTIKIRPATGFVMVKLSGNDHTPAPGVTPPLAAKYAAWLADLGLDAVEVTCGTGSFSNMNIWRGDLPVSEMVNALPLAKRPGARVVFGRMAGKFGFQEGYNLEAARAIKAAAPGMPVALVGGLRHVEFMEKTLQGGDTDLVSMSRPFIREPRLADKLRGGAERVHCVSCNRCLAATIRDEPTRCALER
jgi:2,4-dienoyl-CoA reductase-like NADH-dependent reductase (Old Yellow Enzyme family)